MNPTQIASAAAARLLSLTALLTLLTLLLGPTAALEAQQAAAPARPRQVVPMDSARAALLYVSNRHEDHPVANYAAAVAAKARTDSIFAERSRGVMRYEKTSYRSRHDDLDIPVYVFSPLQSRGARAHAAMVWVHGGAWREGARTSVRPEFARNGIATASVSYRLSTEARFPAMAHDIKAAIRFLRARASTYGYRADRIARRTTKKGAP